MRAEMLCKQPFVDSAGRVFGCGQCMPCRVNKRRIWAHRIMLETLKHADNCFCTLSYADEFLPDGGNLSSRDLQLFLKRLRFRYAGKIRFFAVGEYGDDSERPHYHVALFGYPNCRYGQSQYGRQRSKCCATCDFVADIWKKGNIFLGSLTQESAAYIAGYVTKKMTSSGDPRLKGKVPEFARMSLRPGIGGSAMEEVADVVLRHSLRDRFGDVPNSLRHGGKELPLGRYLMQRVRVLSGYEKNAPQIVLDKIDAEMRPLREAARADNENPSLKARVIEKNSGRVAGMEARQRIFSQRKRVL